MNDEKLIVQFRKSGDNQWLGVLLERYTMLLLGVGLKYLKDKARAQDAVQQVFIKAITHFPEGPIQNFKGWLYILMRNHCFGVLRTITYNASDEVLAHMPEPEQKTREELLEEESLREQLINVLGTLNEEQHTCIRLFYLERKSYKEIMEQTNFTFEQVKSFVQNGKRNLRIALLKKKQQS